MMQRRHCSKLLRLWMPLQLPDLRQQKLAVVGCGQAPARPTLTARLTLAVQLLPWEMLPEGSSGAGSRALAVRLLLTAQSAELLMLQLTMQHRECLLPGGRDPLAREQVQALVQVPLQLKAAATSLQLVQLPLLMRFRPAHAHRQSFPTS